MSQVSSNTQVDFEEIPYKQASWEIVGEKPPHPEFIPLDVTVVSRVEQLIDPMFHDYGGTSEQSKKRFLHLPEGVENVSALDGDMEEVVPEVPSITLEEAELRIQQAKAEAETATREEMQKQWEEERRSLSERYETILADLQSQIFESQQTIASEATELAVQFAKKLIEEAVEINPEYILPLINEALGLAATANVIRVRVSPQDYEFLEVMKLGKKFEDGKSGWDFVADESIRLGCVVDTSAGEIDFQLDSAWERIKDSVVRVLR